MKASYGWGHWESYTLIIHIKSFVIYNEMDGILPNDFLAKPALVASDGNIYMGGSEGLVRINKALKPASAPPPITLKLQEIALNGTTVHFIPRSTMEIPYNFSSLKYIHNWKGEMYFTSASTGSV